MWLLMLLIRETYTSGDIWLRRGNTQDQHLVDRQLSLQTAPNNM